MIIIYYYYKMITMTAVAKRKLVDLIEKSGKSAYLYLHPGRFKMGQFF